MMSDFMILDGWLVIKVSIDKRSRAHPGDPTNKMSFEHLNNYIGSLGLWFLVVFPVLHLENPFSFYS